MTNQEPTDSRYYRSVTPRSLGERLTIAARSRIYADFLRRCRPSPDDRILDVGVSDVVNDAANVLERGYPHQDRITAVGLGEGRDFVRAYPQASYVRVEPNRPLPFCDNSFEIATSNAVLEHVGSEEYQKRFIRELLRVARKVFVSVPNRYFPVEHHTAIPLLHFCDPVFRIACDWLGKDEWSRNENLILMSRGRLSALCPDGSDPAIGYTGLTCGWFSSNLYMFLEATDRP